MQEVATIARELGLAAAAVQAAVTMLDEGATVPFIARYRKEATQGLDDTQLRALEERLGYVRELNARREAIAGAIAEQGKLSDTLRAQLDAATTKTELEDLYLPYKLKRRTKAQIAREAGLEPLALGLWETPTLEPATSAAEYLNPDAGITTVKEALEGAKQILMERWAEDAELLAQLRAYLHERGYIVAKVAPGKESEGAKFRDYFDHRELLASAPSHRLLAMLRGRNEGVLQLSLGLKEDVPAGEAHPCETLLASRVGVRAAGRPADAFLAETVRWTFRVKLLTKLETDLMGDARERAEGEAISVFARNLKALLLAAPAGAVPTIGLDPGLRTGVKVAVVSETGRVLDTGVIYPTLPQLKIREAERALKQWCVSHDVRLIAIGNGTASRETEKFVTDFLKANPELKIQKVIVSEAGASVYSASELAAKEFPELDVTVRGAISIARRLQDPLAELVKIEPKAIGVGQYQHDVSQTRLGRSLDAVVEDCVNAVGVEINTASAPLLARVAGLNGTIAGNIISHRDQHGPFASRQQLLKVSRLGPKAFEQCAGFLRVRGGDNPLDSSGVHPEAYGLVAAIATDAQRSVDSLIGDSGFLRKVEPKQYVTEQFGLPTITDILKELDKPGRDPRPEFQTARFAEGVENLKDLQPGMVLEGTVTNVTNFGAFVDIGVHQDGLVHISALADTFVKDPHAVVAAGQVVKVKVMEVDLERKRIALSMRLGDSIDAGAPGGGKPPGGRPTSGKRPAMATTKAPANTLAALFEQAKQDPKKR